MKLGEVGDLRLFRVTYICGVIIQHHLRSDFSVLKSFISTVEDKTSFLEIKLRFTLPTGTASTYLLMSLNSMFWLPAIQCALKLTRKNMFFLWVEASILLDYIISLMSFLVELLLTKKHLTMNSLPVPRSTALALVPSPMPIYLNLRKNFSYGTGSLGSVCIEPKNSCKQLKLMYPPVFAMKCLLSSLLFSTPNLKTHPCCQLCQWKLTQIKSSLWKSQLGFDQFPTIFVTANHTLYKLAGN